MTVHWVLELELEHRQWDRNIPEQLQAYFIPIVILQWMWPLENILYEIIIPSMDATLNCIASLVKRTHKAGQLQCVTGYQLVTFTPVVKKSADRVFDSLLSCQCKFFTASFE